MEQANFTYSSLGKALEKQTKAIVDAAEKQTNATDVESKNKS